MLGIVLIINTIMKSHVNSILWPYNNFKIYTFMIHKACIMYHFIWRVANMKSAASS